MDCYVPQNTEYREISVGLNNQEKLEELDE